LKTTYDSIALHPDMLSITEQDYYACAMVKIHSKTLPLDHRAQALLGTDWPNMVASFIVGLSHYRCYYADPTSKLSIEMHRRSGFGYNEVTIASTEPSVRINLGLAPQEYVNTLGQTLADLNKVLGYLQFKKTPLKASVFIRQKNYAQYSTPVLTAVLKSSPAVTSYVNLLWAAVEVCKNKKGEKNLAKTTLHNILRSSQGRDYISFQVCDYLMHHKSTHTSEISHALKRSLQHNVFDKILELINKHHPTETLQKERLKKAFLEIKVLLTTQWDQGTLVAKEDWAVYAALLKKSVTDNYETKTVIDETCHLIDYYTSFFCCDHLTVNDTLILCALEHAVIKAIDCIEINETLSFNQDKALIHYKDTYKTKNAIPVTDVYYWSTLTQLVGTLTTQYANLKLHEQLEKSIYKLAATDLQASFTQTFTRLKKAITDRDYTTLGLLLTYLNELFFEYSIIVTAPASISYASDSDDEAEIDLEEGAKPIIFAKKFVTHNGMLAIISALTCAIEHVSLEDKKNVSSITPYYEFEAGVAILPQFLEIANIDIKNFPEKIEIKKQMKNSKILFIDLAPCLTLGETADSVDTFIFNIKQEFIIIDSTSLIASDPELLKLMNLLITNNHIKAVILVESGLKHDQIFDGKTHFGFIRIFTKNNILRDTFFLSLPKEFKERAVIANSHRRLIKELGGTQTNRKYLTAVKDFAQKARVSSTII
ncbi:hypothetical protein EBS02_07180, partial [bacterium]|nr:hypothetical protein [bacterium]